MAEAPMRLLLIEPPGEGEGSTTDRQGLGEGTPANIERAGALGEAIDSIRGGAVDAVILDLDFPEGAGMEILRELAATFPELPLVVIVGDEDEETSLRAVREGAQDCLLRSSLGAVQALSSVRLAIERKRGELALRRREERLALALEGTEEGLWDWDLHADEVFFSPRWKEILGYAGDEIGDSVEEWFSRVHPADLDGLKRDISAHLTGRAVRLESEHRIRDSHGSYRWMLCRGRAVRAADGPARRIAGSLSDINARKLTEQQLLHDAMHDALTGLANAALLMDRLAIAMGQARRRPADRFAVLFLDLDRFKRVNDSLGHGIGDQLLVGVALRLQRLLRPGDTVARLGGDEFALLVHDIRNPSDATRIAERVHEELRRPFELDGHEVITSTSIGIALSSGSYTRPEDLLHDADTAMYRAKYRGPGRHAIFDEEMHRQATELLETENDLRRAIREQEFVLLYQPIVSLESGELEGFEALVRWRHPRRGLLLPAEFIDVAEKTGLMIPIGWELMREACGQMATWHRQLPGIRKVAISVNLSSRQFRHPELAEHLQDILSRTEIDPAKLRLEVAESSIVDNTEAAVTKLKRLSELGVHLHIDDFGIGRSSLACLHELPAQALEIDRTFVGWMDESPEAPRVVGTIISLARSVGMKVAAEGLETHEQLCRLRRMKCEYGQGYYFSPPLAADETRELIVSRPRW